MIENVASVTFFSLKFVYTKKFLYFCIVILKFKIMRINVGINPECLTDEHLLAEHREIMMIPSFLNKAIKSGNVNKIPNQLNLGKGYATFFINKLSYVICRYMIVNNECIKRGFNVKSRIDELWSLPLRYFGTFVPDGRERNLLSDRISERILNSPKAYFHYRGKKITKEEAIQLLQKSEATIMA